MPKEVFAVQNQPAEWSLKSGKPYRDPFNEVELDVVVTHSSGQEWRLPAYWSGGNEWRVRFAPPRRGTYTYRSVCSDEENRDLNALEGRLKAEPYRGRNPLLKHGFIEVMEDRRHFQHADGTPFFWLGDTWWMGLCSRLSWPDDFQLLAADRVRKGFTVIQVIAGLYPDMPPFDTRGANEAGYPWEREYARINPAYFDMADLRIGWLVRSGLVPCVVGCWGYFLPWMGVGKLKQHWRNLVARWGSYPAVWCLAGEATMPYYLSENKDAEREMQKKGWTEIAAYVREIDAYRHPITIHPTNIGRDQVEDPALLDFDMLQTGHGDRKSAANHIRSIGESMGREPRMPVLVGEVAYEGIMEACRPEIQRYMFWSAMLSGTAGHTYGANGIWQVNTAGKPFGPSPHGSSWGSTPWEEAYRLPGSAHLGLGKGILEQYRWWEFEAHPDWIDAPWSEQEDLKPFAAGIPGEVILVYNPSWRKLRIKGLGRGEWKAAYIDPKNGDRYALGRAKADSDGAWEAPSPTIFQDWILVLAARRKRISARGS
jgi:hypothetical protein